MLHFKACPKCVTGTVEHNRDSHGTYVQCLNCGFMRDLTDGISGLELTQLLAVWRGGTISRQSNPSRPTRLRRAKLQASSTTHANRPARIVQLQGRRTSVYYAYLPSAFLPASIVSTIMSTSKTQPPHVPPLTAWSAAQRRVSSGS